MEKYQRKSSGLLKNVKIISIFESCELTWIEKYLVSGLHPIVTEVTKNFCLKHCDRDILLHNNATTNQIISYKKKIDFMIELLEPCEKFLKNFPLWAKQRKETIAALRNVEKPLKDLVTKCHPILRALGPKFHFMLSNVLVNLSNPQGRLTETQKKALVDLKSQVEENRDNALKMCTVDHILLHEMGACEFYDEISDSINDLFGVSISHEILEDLSELLKILPGHIDNVENIYNLLKTCLDSILPKISTLLSKGFSISCTILSIFLVVFMTRRQSCAILFHLQDLEILNSAESAVDTLIAAARVKGSKFENMISSEMKKKIAFGAVDKVAITLEMATIVLNSIDVNDGFLISESELMMEITNKLEKDLNSYQRTFEVLERSSKESLKMRDVTNWTTVIIYHVPTGTNQIAIKSAVRQLLREKAKDCIDLERLPTNGNHWLVKVPTYHCRTLLKEKYIDVAKEKCLLMP